MDSLALPWPVLAVIGTGAAAAAFVTGLAGFGTALVALAFWLHVADPRIAGPLAAICAVTAQISSLATIWRDARLRRLWPFAIGGLVGLPAGVLLLAQVDTALLKAAVGILLIAYSVHGLFLGRLLIGSWGGAHADGAVGVVGGVLGGAAGLAGVLPTVWCAMRGWPSGEQRGVYQPYTLLVLGLAIPAHGLNGGLDARVGMASLVAVPLSLLFGWIGARCYGRLDEAQFRAVVLWLLLISGALLLPR